MDRLPNGRPVFCKGHGQMVCCSGWPLLDERGRWGGVHLRHSITLMIFAACRITTQLSAEICLGQFVSLQSRRTKRHALVGHRSMSLESWVNRLTRVDGLNFRVEAEPFLIY